MDQRIDDKALWNMSYGLYVLTARNGEKKNGQIINVAVQVTVEPMRLAVCISKENLTYEYIRQDRVFGLSVLEQDTPFTFIGTWGFKSGRTTDKFREVNFKQGVAGTPLLLDHALSVIECKVVDTIDVGTHVLFVGEVIGTEVLKTGPALTYEYYHKVIKGKAPKNAPTYRATV
jgi:ferric-chelate reductase [NAD(P)H]